MESGPAPADNGRPNGPRLRIRYGPRAYFKGVVAAYLAWLAAGFAVAAFFATVLRTPSAFDDWWLIATFGGTLALIFCMPLALLLGLSLRRVGALSAHLAAFAAVFAAFGYAGSALYLPAGGPAFHLAAGLLTGACAAFGRWLVRRDVEILWTRRLPPSPGR
ncbi:hypothetical protein NCCP1664_27430 [Zafaria cholistanensis]|uniref:Uncharacterized protein n=1 Tax=Zafaria cholistanensis TaxID=1682741 RepID=A0A5A7NVP3_9MICC|nr:hypothetical protein [Zafaria cholistanensis]GER24248.1 hypothetical protein NCCP1664_27430 [Zafaria cholistanensis]